jgi:hypothetical protein
MILRLPTHRESLILNLDKQTAVLDDGRTKSAIDSEWDMAKVTSSAGHVDVTST